MTPEAQRIAIAEACGRSTKREVLGGVYIYRDPKGFPVAALPDYIHDLNAIAEAERHIVEAGGCYTHYVSELQRLTDRNEWRATAAQRAEAFLRTIGRWVEDKKGAK